MVKPKMHKEGRGALCPYCLEYKRLFVACDSCGFSLCEDCSFMLFKETICIDCFPDEIRKAIYSHPQERGTTI